MSTIPLRRHDGTIRAYAVVDTSDLEWLSQWRWSLTHGYVQRSTTVGGKREKFYMHRELLGLKRGDPLRCDHINMDGLDNRRANLRVVTKKQNEQNCRSRRGSRSQFRGVYLSGGGKWIAEARLNGKKHHIGSFSDEAEAGRAASEWRAVHMPFSADALAGSDLEPGTPRMDAPGSDRIGG